MRARGRAWVRRASCETCRASGGALYCARRAVDIACGDRARRGAGGEGGRGTRVRRLFSPRLPSCSTPGTMDKKRALEGGDGPANKRARR
jgi:hypothetical protein